MCVLQGSAGVLLTFCLGAVLNWWQLSLAHLVLCVPYVIALRSVILVWQDLYCNFKQEQHAYKNNKKSL